MQPGKKIEIRLAKVYKSSEANEAKLKRYLEMVNPISRTKKI